MDRTKDGGGCMERYTLVRDRDGAVVQTFAAETDPATKGGRDLGTYHLRVELMDGRGWIDTWYTGSRYTNGGQMHSPLSAVRIAPTWDSEADVFRAMEFMYTDGNYSCDCNKMLFWCRSQQLDEPEEVECGDAMSLKRLTAIRPDGTEQILWQVEHDVSS